MQAEVSPSPFLVADRESGKRGGNAGFAARDMRFLRDGAPRRWWMNDDPVATAWFTALSGTFPRGEAFFIESVKAHRDGAGEPLASQIHEFILQEVNHSREHIALNRHAKAAGYDMAKIDARVQDVMDQLKGRPQILDLASTIALEHYTAMMAHDFLANPAHLTGSDPEVRDLWRWHAIEEIEHKAVAYDTWLHATRDWSRWKRWRVKSLIMALVTKNFIAHRIADTLDLLAQDGITGTRAKWRVFAYLFWKPGVLRRIFPAWLAFFLPGFHPWNQDDRALKIAAEQELAASRADQAAKADQAARIMPLAS